MLGSSLSALGREKYKLWVIQQKLPVLNILFEDSFLIPFLLGFL